jgi:hypothetical protein
MSVIGSSLSVKAKAHRVAERNGLIWLYMIEASPLPAEDLQVTFAQRECDWLQALEGDIDTSHFGFCMPARSIRRMCRRTI